MINFKNIIPIMTCLLFTSVSAGELDTLETIGPDGSIVSSRIIDGVNVTITPNLGDMQAFTYNDSVNVAFGGIGPNGPLDPGQVSGSRFISNVNAWSLANPIVFTFSTGIKDFGVTTIDILEGGALASEIIQIKAFDSSNNLLDSDILTGPQGPSGLALKWFVSSTTSNITRVSLSGTHTLYSGFGIDDIYVNAVPEPSTYALLGLGLVGLGIYRRKTKKS